MIDERTENLINRRLDGELTDDESLELDKRLIRSPGAQALMEEYERAGLVAGEVLRTAVGENDVGHDRAEQLARTAAFRGRPWRAWRGGVAVAAVFLGVIIGVGMGYWLSTPAVPVTSDPAVVQPSDVTEPLIATAPTELDRDKVRSLEQPPRRERRVVQDVVGVFDEKTRSVYLLEASRVETSLAPVRANY